MVCIVSAQVIRSALSGCPCADAFCALAARTTSSLQKPLIEHARCQRAILLHLRRPLRIRAPTSRAFSCPMKPAATGSASPASFSPRPFTWECDAMRSVFVVDFTSSIFILHRTQTRTQQNTKTVSAACNGAGYARSAACSWRRSPTPKPRLGREDHASLYYLLPTIPPGAPRAPAAPRPGWPTCTSCCRCGPPALPAAATLRAHHAPAVALSRKDSGALEFSRTPTRFLT